MANRMDRKAWTVNGLKPYPMHLLLKPLRKIPQFVIKLHRSRRQTALPRFVVAVLRERFLPISA